MKKTAKKSPRAAKRPTFTGRKGPRRVKEKVVKHPEKPVSKHPAPVAHATTPMPKSDPAHPFNRPVLTEADAEADLAGKPRPTKAAVVAPEVDVPAPVVIRDEQGRVKAGLTLDRQTGALLQPGSRVGPQGADFHRMDRSVQILAEGEIVPS